MYVIISAIISEKERQAIATYVGQRMNGSYVKEVIKIDLLKTIMIQTPTRQGMDSIIATLRKITKKRKNM